jgi:phosphoribosylanthranilate isomerase
MPTGPGVIDMELARQIARSIPPPVTPYLLSSCSDAEALVEHARSIGVSTVQIVRHVEPSAHQKMAELAPWLRRVQVLHVENEAVIELAAAYEPYVDGFLLDSGRPATGELGGTGRTHDWTLSARLVAATHRPTFLAGGLTGANVAEALQQVRPFGVDVCSGVRSDGQLDPQRLAALCLALPAHGHIATAPA